MSGKELDSGRVQDLLEKERAVFRAAHPRSLALFAEARSSLLNGVPMPWLVKWAGGFPLFVAEGRGSRFRDVDGFEYLDLCLGDTGAMSGHAPPETARVVAEQARRGLTFMLPHEDAIWVSRHLTERYNSPKVASSLHVCQWQFAMTATDANRFVLRLCRHITGRKKVLVFNWCYHGTVDETFITLEKDGSTHARAGNLGPAADVTTTTKVVEFNDLAALERALKARDVAAVLCEPAMTNIGIVLPDAGFHAALRRLTRETGTLLIIDETHTISAGYGGMTRRDALEPDVLVIGKPLAGGVPAAVYGFNAEVAQQIRDKMPHDESDTGGIGGTLTANALAVRAMRATLEHVLTAEAYERMLSLGDVLARDVQAVIDEYRLPFIVKQLGCRVEYWPAERAPRNGGEAAAAGNADIDALFHIFALNRGVLITPFHNMLLLCPDSNLDDVKWHTRVFRDCVRAVLGYEPLPDASPVLRAPPAPKL